MMGFVIRMVYRQLLENFMTSIDDSKIDALDDLEETQTGDYGEYADDNEHDETAEVMDIDEMMESVTGNKPKAGEPFSMAEEVEKDEEDRRGV
jgi:hypothetical protein